VLDSIVSTCACWAGVCFGGRVSLTMGRGKSWPSARGGGGPVCVGREYEWYAGAP
jgi:hypothetical protein